jgi:chemotaxis family two-component system sensor histidine kinase/response regulator PixL
LAISAIEAHPDQALQVTQVALADFIAARQAVIDGDRIQGGTPSEALIKLANSSNVVTAGNNLFETVGTIDVLPLQVIPENNIFSNVASEDVSAISGLDDIFGDALNFEPTSLELTAVTPITSGSQELKPIEQENIYSIPDLLLQINVSLDDLFGDALNVEPASLDSNPAVTAIPEALPQKQTSIASSEQFPLFRTLPI